jgi:two-component system sensor histidine kinase YesM
VENALIHGLMNDTKAEKQLSIAVYRQQDNVVLTIADNGVGIEQQRINDILNNHKDSYGIYNVKERLSLFYNSEKHLRLESEPGNGTIVFITIPYR